MNSHQTDRWSENHAWPDRAIAELAARQAANIAHQQLRALDVPRSTIGTAIARGRLHPVHHGVYSLVPTGARPRLAEEHAALLVCGPSSLISHESAAELHGLELAKSSNRVHVTVVGSRRGRRRPHLHVHTTGELARDERNRRIGGLAVTSLARTVFDLAAGRSERAVEHLVDQALRRTSRSKLLAILERHPGRPGTPALREALQPDRPSSETWSLGEERLLMALRRAGVPAPEANVKIGRYRPDLSWREFRVLVEYQSQQFHSSERARIADAQRHNDLTSWGFTVLHITRRDLHRTEQMLVWIVAALVQNGWSTAA